MNANEMIDRYVNEVGEHLPRKMRGDIEMELRSLLLDTLDEQSGNEPTLKITAEILREFGHPEDIAAQYRPTEFLIGPKLFPTYKMAIIIMLSIIGVLQLLGTGFVLWQSNGARFVNTVLSFSLSFGRTALFNFGIVTLIFALVERAAERLPELTKPKVKTWDPYQLPPVKDTNRINRGEMVLGIIFTLIFISWLNFFPNWFGGAQFSETSSGIFALFTPEFILLIPWITVYMLLDVVLKTAVVIQGRWHRLTRGLELVILIFWFYLAYRIFRLEAISTVPFFTTMAKAVLAVILIIGIFEIGTKLLRLLGHRDQRDRFFKRASPLA